MPTTTRICKVCGKEYEYCHTLRRVEGIFRYQDVACCPEHGSIYLAEVGQEWKILCTILSSQTEQKFTLH